MAGNGVPKLRRGSVDDASRGGREDSMVPLSKVLHGMGGVGGGAGKAGASAQHVVRDSYSVLCRGRLVTGESVNPRLVWRSFYCPRCQCLMRAGFYPDQRYSVFRKCRKCRACWNLWRNGVMERDRAAEESLTGPGRET